MKMFKDVILVVVLLAASVVMMVGVYGCGTVRGIGEDLQNFGAYETQR